MTPSANGAAATPTAAQTLAAWAAGLRYADIPADVADAAKLHLLDAVGTGIAGLGLGELPATRAAAAELGGRPEATAIGLPEKLGAGAAALANGALMHALDFDDTHEVGILHSSVVVGPVVLAVGEQLGSSGEEMIAAAVAGYEIGSRLGLAAPGKFHLKGWHPTSVCGVFAGAACAAKLRGLDAAGIANALGIAGSQASGILEFLSDGSQTKPLHAGWASLAGIVAASLAANGGTGPATVLEGRFGLLNTHLAEGEFDVAALTAELGTRWETPRIAYKLYPTCHFTHTSLDAAAKLDLAPEEVEEIVALMPSEVPVKVVLEPGERKLRPTTAYDAKFSLPYCLSALIHHGELGVDRFTLEAIADEKVLELAGRVRYEIVDFPGGSDMSGGVRVKAGGVVREERVTRPRGGFDSPVPASEIAAKFTRNALLGLSAADADALLDQLLHLERTDGRAVGASLAKVQGGIRQ